MSQKTLNLCLERYNFVKFGETTKSSHTVLCINNANNVNSAKYRLTPTAIASKHGDGYVFTLNYDFDRPLFTIVQKSYSLDGTSGNIVFEGIDPISKGGSKYLRKVTVSPVKLSGGSYLLEVTNDEYLRIGTTGADLGDEELESLNEKIVTMGGIEKSVETVGGKQVLKLDGSGPSGKEIVYFDVDPSDPPSGLYSDITVALSNDKEPVIKIDGAVYFYTATGTDKYVFVGGYTKDAVGYTEIEVSDDDSVASKSVDDKVFNMYILPQDDPASPGETPSEEDQWVCDADKHVITKDELVAAHADCRYFILNNAVEPDSNSRKYFASVTVISNSYIRLRFYMMQYDAQGVAEFYQKTVVDDSEGRLYILSSYSATLAGTIQAVLVSEPQDFNSTQKAQGRDNIGAASASDVTALQSQVSSLSDVSAYTAKGEATVAQLNAGPSGIQAGWAYQLTDSGTLTDGTLAVVAGDTVAWDGTKWFPLVKSDYYATKTYAQNVAHSIAPEFDPEKTGGYIFGETFADGGKTYLTIDDFSGAFDASKVLNVDGAFIDFFSSFVNYFRKNGLGQNGELRTRAYGNITFYLVPIPAGTHVSIKKTYSSMSAPAADFVRYNSDKSVKSYVNAKSIDYTTTEDEYLSFVFQPQDKFPVFVLPTSLHTDVIGSLILYETKAVADFILDDRWKIRNGYLDANGNIGYSTSDYGWECSYKISMPKGAKISITKSAGLSSSWKDFVAYDADGEVLASANGTSFSHEFADDGFLSFVRLPSGTFTIKANKVLETFASFYRPKELNIKSLSIISSSSSTYYGFIPSGQIAYYGPIAASGQVDLPNGVKDTWWHKVCSQLGIPLLLNDSASGSYYTTAGGIGTPQITRLENVYGEGTVGSVRPDLLIFYTCINDSYNNVEVGLPKYSDWNDADKSKIAPALCYGMDLIQKYCPGVKILNIMNFTLNASIRAAMVEICEHYGVKNILLPTCERTDGHPTARGMTQISEFVKRAIVDML